MAEERCPYCGVKLQAGNNGELFCPNHGIIRGGCGSDSKETPSYCG